MKGPIGVDLVRAPALSGRFSSSPLSRRAILFFRPALAWPPQHVAHSAYRLDDFWTLRIGFDLGTQPVDVDVDGARLADILVTPDAFEQLLAAEYLAGVADEEGQQVEGFRLYRPGLAVAKQPVAGHVDLRPAHAH